MNRTLLVARREYRQVASTRGFRITLLVVPLAIALSVLAARFIHPQQDSAYAIVDESGRYAAAIEHRVELNYQREVLSELATYVEKQKVATGPGAPWATSQGWYGDAQAEAFLAGGGLPAALRAMEPRLPPGAPAFKPPDRPWERIEPPPGVSIDQGPERLGATLAPAMRSDVKTAAGKRPLALVVYIPKDFGQPGQVARLWTSGSEHAGTIETVRDELTRALRSNALQAAGLSAPAAAQVDQISAPIFVTQAASGNGRVRVMIHSAAPLALCYLLLITAMTTGSLLLQGVIEERSNKLLEAVLACVRPQELMSGKLLGLGAIGLTVVVVWVGFAIGSGLIFKDVGDVIVPSLRSLDQPWMIVALLFYFLAGYLIASMAFLGIGSVSNSMQDAQAFLMPVMMAILLPVVLMINATLLNPGGPIPRVMSWIPLYTPYAMLIRLNSGVSILEVVATGALTIAFIALEFLVLGRIFRASLLSTGQPPSPAAFLKLILQPPEG